MRGDIFCQLCTGYLRGQQSGHIHIGRHVRHFRNLPPVRQARDGFTTERSPRDHGPTKGEEQGAMSRRLAEMSDEMLENSGRRAQKTVEEAGFSEELKQQLQDRIAAASFASDNAQAIASANLASSAGAGTKDIAGARPWTGSESLEDATLRMLDDAHRRIRTSARVPGVRMPKNVDTGRPAKVKVGSAQGARLANARDQTSRYAYLKDASISEKEREAMRKELKERFAPAARDVPATLQGLASLANERIEDAIARGQFKNIARGKPIERDYNASSPFLDTTEYFMNKIIQKQDIVPPWIEKQQELASEATKFRSRLRNDWKRHVARSIASKGGSVEKQVTVAEAYARAEAVDNPPRSKVAAVSTIFKEDGQISQITLSGELKAGDANTPTESTVIVTETMIEPPTAEGSVSATTAGITSGMPASSATVPAVTDAASSPTAGAPPTQVTGPFRDAAWLKTEASYHALCVANLNAIARSYNLMAPELARKPYFSLERELLACYADSAPLIGAEIRERSRIPAGSLSSHSRRRDGAVGVMERLVGEPSKVYDEVRPKYGFKEFWRDLFAADDGVKRRG